MLAQLFGALVPSRATAAAFGTPQLRQDRCRGPKALSPDRHSFGQGQSSWVHDLMAAPLANGSPSQARCVWKLSSRALSSLEVQFAVSESLQPGRAEARLPFVHPAQTNASTLPTANP